MDIMGGQISVAASDDGINAAGGNLWINASGDGIDSNGDLTVSGGETYLSGPVNGGTARWITAERQ